MNKRKNRYKKIKNDWIKELIESGDYEVHLDEIFDLIISEEASINRNLFLDIQKQTTFRINISFYATIFSMLFSLALFGLGIFIVLEHNLLAGSLISTMGCTISGFITKTFIKMYKISLDQLNRFYHPLFKEIISIIKNSIDYLPDLKSKKEAHMLMINILLKILEKTN